jgi:hypothetical protein
MQYNTLGKAGLFISQLGCSGLVTPTAIGRNNLKSTLATKPVAHAFFGRLSWQRLVLPNEVQRVKKESTKLANLPIRM